ncbi:MAG: hypothetical protein ACRCY4_03440 [Brevinema sp.]
MRFFIEFLFSMAVMGFLGLVCGFIYARFIQRNLLGGVRAGMVVGTLGCILGGFLFNMVFDTPLLKWMNDVPYLNILLVNYFDVNFIAACLGIVLFLYVYRQISSQQY